MEIEEGLELVFADARKLKPKQGLRFSLTLLGSGGDLYTAHGYLVLSTSSRTASPGDSVTGAQRFGFEHLTSTFGNMTWFSTAAYIPGPPVGNFACHLVVFSPLDVATAGVIAEISGTGRPETMDGLLSPFHVVEVAGPLVRGPFSYLVFVCRHHVRASGRDYAYGASLALQLLL